MPLTILAGINLHGVAFKPVKVQCAITCRGRSHALHTMAGIVSEQDFGSLIPVATHNSNVGDMSDHGVFRRNGVPYLFLSCGRWKHYHSASDTPEKLNYGKMAQICVVLSDRAHSGRITRGHLTYLAVYAFMGRS